MLFLHQIPLSNFFHLLNLKNSLRIPIRFSNISIAVASSSLLLKNFNFQRALQPLSVHLSQIASYTSFELVLSVSIFR